MQTASIAIINGLALVSFALLLRFAVITLRQMAGRSLLAVPVRATSNHRRSLARVRPADILVACQSLRAPPTLLAPRRRVNSGISSPD